MSEELKLCEKCKENPVMNDSRYCSKCYMELRKIKNKNIWNSIISFLTGVGRGAGGTIVYKNLKNKKKK